jgi:carbamoyltransferase
MLKEDARKLLEPFKRENRFMTVGYAVKKGHWPDLMAASHIDGTTRPQMLGDENKQYRRLLERIRKKTGYGALLNTSLNKHGRPMVMDPQDAIWTLLNTGASKLAIGNFMVEKNKKTSSRN